LAQIVRFLPETVKNKEIGFPIYGKNFSTICEIKFLNKIVSRFYEKRLRRSGAKGLILLAYLHLTGGWNIFVANRKI
jgi:hypothetical protein